MFNQFNHKREHDNTNTKFSVHVILDALQILSVTSQECRKGSCHKSVSCPHFWPERNKGHLLSCTELQNNLALPWHNGFMLLSSNCLQFWIGTLEPVWSTWAAVVVQQITMDCSLSACFSLKYKFQVAAPKLLVLKATLILAYFAWI